MLSDNKLTAAIMSLKAGSGRKKVSVIWNYFEHRPLTDKSECKTCKFQLKGCNPTNLVTHLRQHHEVYKEYEKNKKEQEELQLKAGSNQKQSTVLKNMNIEELLNKKSHVQAYWHVDSPAHKTRMAALMNMFSTAGLPCFLIDNPGFRAYCPAMDPKFKLPR